MKPYSIFYLGEICLVSLQEEINDEEISTLSKELSGLVKSKKIDGIIIDLGNIEVIDTFLADNIQKLALTMHLFRAKTVVCGLNASAILALKSFELTFERDLVFALDAKKALGKLGYKIVRVQGGTSRDILGGQQRDGENKRY